MTGVFVDLGSGPRYYYRVDGIWGFVPQADWPAPDPSTRVRLPGCDWHDCTKQGARRYGYWGKYHWLCAEHGDLIGDDGSMDDTYDTDAERAAALKRVGL